METGEILLQKGLLDSRQLELARESQKEDERADQSAVQMGFVSEEDALKAAHETVSPGVRSLCYPCARGRLTSIITHFGSD